jgi:hypothetical protein
MAFQRQPTSGAASPLGVSVMSIHQMSDEEFNEWARNEADVFDPRDPADIENPEPTEEELDEVLRSVSSAPEDLSYFDDEDPS